MTHLNYLPRTALLLAFIVCCAVKSAAQKLASPEETEIAALIKKAKTAGPKDTTTAKTLFQQAEALAGKIHNDTCLAQVYNAWGIMYAQADASKKTTLYYFEKQLQHAQASGYEKQVSVALRNTANILSDMGDNTTAITRYQKALEICRRLKMPEQESSNLVNLGIVYMSMGQYGPSMESLLNALRVSESINDLPQVAYVQYTTAGLYSRMKNFDKALEYNQLALQSFRKLDNQLIVNSILFNMATIQIKKKEYAEAKTNLLSTLPYFEKINSQERQRKVYVQLINIADQTGNEADAIKYLQQAVRYSTFTGAVVNDVGVLVNQARLDMFNKQFTDAEEKLQKALAMAQKGNAFFEVLNVRRQFIVLYQESAQPAKAAAELSEYDMAKEKVLNEENVSKINELQTQYETEKKENRITLLDKENSIKSLQLRNSQLEIERKQQLITEQQQSLTIGGLELKNKDQLLTNQQLDAEKKAQNIKTLEKQSQLQNLEIENQGLAVKQRNYAIMAILVAFIAIGGLSFSYYKRQKLKQQHRLQAEIYKQQEIATKAVFDGEQQERIRIARDLHDSIGQMLSVVKMNVSTMDTTNPVAAHTQQLVDKTITEVRNISHNLIPEELNFGLFNALEDIANKINEAGGATVTTNIPDSIRQLQLSRQNELSIYRIVQEVLNNMIKHANATLITLDMERTGNNLLLVIKDNGKGFDAAAINESKGIGWKNISARVHLLNGDLNVRSERLSGTTIEISIPA